MPDDASQTSTKPQQNVKRITSTDADFECSSLTGPFCVHTDSMTFFESYMTPISTSWMDSGGNANDILNQPVANVDECEQLCCEHSECVSFTFWRGRTCFLRAVSKAPRYDDDSFSGIRLI
ncbi:hypothetical protein BBO99_00004084 [Phytophthora kernoviae]|uniref:Apple domain-containing protein n=2 Tax=Phytophthora kernoviae TaxID=325452 RepID=A0A3R7K0A4_9STRA|nr:hypothetical protein G195_004711 [Phytophthora kernoviae 00238/432]KAG2526499.1 hypothetical protein JM16_002868 [Phytophthora kernoviae]KAG2527978.1 hypothetical protein JM18_003427 [Phytophthora kernoviae]RLN14615.1 hypothetical protein BBI17_004212 [Phytophthora kernoviae]RLN81011.1 hypothetical protein BBO99_00004084 [Phytophthora kernoviae]